MVRLLIMDDGNPTEIPSSIRTLDEYLLRKDSNAAIKAKHLIRIQSDTSKKAVTNSKNDPCNHISTFSRQPVSYRWRFRAISTYHRRVYVKSGTQCFESDESLPAHGIFHVCFRMRGGKGGFRSQLREQGNRRSNTETDNIEACRDLSGRRLRHIHDEKQIAKWFSEEQERKEEQHRRRLAKLERAVSTPKHAFDQHKLSIELNQQSTSVGASVNQVIKSGNLINDVRKPPEFKRFNFADDWDSATTKSSEEVTDDELVTKRSRTCESSSKSRDIAKSKTATPAITMSSLSEPSNSTPDQESESSKSAEKPSVPNPSHETITTTINTTV